MVLKAICREKLKETGLNELPETIKFNGKENFVPDSYGERIGRYNEDTKEYKSYFKKDVEAGNTAILEDYEDLLSMIVSIRLLKCEFVEK